MRRYVFSGVMLFSYLFLAGCGSNNSGAGNGGGDRIVVQAETSALYGTNETLGIFDIAASSSVTTFTPVSGNPLVSLSQTTSGITVTNQSGIDLKGVVMRVASIEEPFVSLTNSDGGNFHNFGDIPAGQSMSMSVTFTGTGTGRIYVTQKKETVTTGVLEYGAGNILQAPSSSGIFTEKALSYAPATTGAISQGASTSVKTDSAGNPKVSYSQVDTYDLKYAYWDGLAWQTVTVDSTGKTGYYSSLALTSLGNPRISYYSGEDASGTPTGDLMYAYCNANCDIAANWGTVTVDSTSDVGGYSSLSLDSLGNPRIAYYDFVNRDLKYAYCDTACEISANWVIVTVDSTGYIGSYGSLSLNSAGSPRISYYDYTNGDLKYAYCDSACSNPANWTKVTVDATSNVDVGGYTSIAINSAGNPRISYYDFTNYDLKYAYCDTGCNIAANWTKVTVDKDPFYYYLYGNPYTYETIVNSTISDFTIYRQRGVFSSLALDSSGNPYITYYYNKDTDPYDNAILKGDLMYASCLSNCSSSASWSKSTIDTPNDTGWFTSIAVSNANNAYITYYSATNKNLYIMGLKVPMPTVGAVDAASYTGDSHSLKTDLNNYPHISYAVNYPDGSKTSSAVKYAFWNGSMWKTVTIDSAPVQVNGWQPQTSLALTSTGKPRILYTWDRDFLKYAFCDAGCDIATNWTKVSLTVNPYLPPLKPPDATNLGTPQLLTSSNSWPLVDSTPEVIQITGGYRLYYTASGAYYGLAYRDTTNANPPDSTNLGAKQTLNTGSSTSDQASGVRVIPITGGYRMYYTYCSSNCQSSGAAWTIAYKDTTDANPPISTNLGARQLLSAVAVGKWGNSPEIVRLPSLQYRLYYTLTSGIRYRDTTDTNPPNNTNLGTEQVLIASGSLPDYQQDPSVIQLPSGRYRIYYTHGLAGYGLQLLYRDTTNTNPPDSTNLGASQLLNTGVYVPAGSGDPSLDASNPKVIQLTSGQYKLYYVSYDAMTGKTLFYKDVSGNSQTVFGPSLALDSADNPRISYWNNSSLQYAYCDLNCNIAASWTAATVGSSIGDYSDSGGQTSLLLNTSNNPRIAYYDATNADLKYAYCDAGCNAPGGWTTATVASSDDSGRYASLALNSSGNPRIAYTRIYSTNVMNYTYCDANCNLPASWTTGLSVSNSKKGNNNQLLLDNSGKARINLMVNDFYGTTVDKYAPYHASCGSGCNSQANWTYTQHEYYFNTGWTSLAVNSSNLIQSGYYNTTTDVYGNAGLYYRWDYNLP